MAMKFNKQQQQEQQQEQQDIETLIETFLSDNQLIEYIIKEIKKNNKISNFDSRNITKVIDKVFNDLQLQEIVTVYLNQINLKGKYKNIPEYSESEPLQSQKNKRKSKDIKNNNILQEEDEKTTTTTKIDFNKSQTLDPYSISHDQMNNSFNFNPQSDIIISSPQIKQDTTNQTQNQNQNQKNKIDKILWVEVPEVDNQNGRQNIQQLNFPRKNEDNQNNHNNNIKNNNHLINNNSKDQLIEGGESEEEYLVNSPNHQNTLNNYHEEEEEDYEESQNRHKNIIDKNAVNNHNKKVYGEIDENKNKINNYNRYYEEEEEDDDEYNEEEEVENRDDNYDYEYSMNDFETSMSSSSPGKSNHPSVVKLFPYPKQGKKKHQNQVNFVDGYVSDTFIHREKHDDEDVPQLFYTQNEAMQFQYDYDREAERALRDGLD